MMKNFYLLFVFSFIAIVNFAQTPIVITVDDIADEGDEFPISNASPLLSFDPSDTGPDHNWDFSDLTEQSSDTSVWVAVSDTDPLYFFLWFGSDVAEETGAEIENDIITIEDVFNFYERNDDVFGLTAFAGTITGIPIPIAYEDTEIIYEFPANYGDVTNSETGFNLPIPGIATWIEHRTRTNEIDGWGTLTTPAGEFEVLRMRSSIVIVDTIIYDAIPFGFSYTTIEYRWVAKEQGIPVLQINAQEILGTETITQVIYKREKDIIAINNSPSNNISISVIENPISENISFTYNSPSAEKILIQLFDVFGKIVFDEEVFSAAGKSHFTKNVNLMADGIYVISLSINNKIFATEKIVKQ